MNGKANGARRTSSLLWVSVLVTVLVGFSGCADWSYLYFGTTAESGTDFWLDILTECPQDAELCAEIDISNWGEDILLTGYNIGRFVHLSGSANDISVDLVGIGTSPGPGRPTVYYALNGTITVEMGAETLKEAFNAILWAYPD